MVTLNDSKVVTLLCTNVWKANAVGARQVSSIKSRQYKGQYVHVCFAMVRCCVVEKPVLTGPFAAETVFSICE